MADHPAWRASIDKRSPGRRDYQIVVLLSGLRRMDAATIRWEHIDLDARTLHRPNPKGGADRAFTTRCRVRALRSSNRSQVGAR